MWNKRKEDELAPKSAAPPTPAELGREGIPMSTLPGRLTEPEAPRGVATIGKSVVLKGQIFSREDLYVDGEVDGTIELPRLAIDHESEQRICIARPLTEPRTRQPRPIHLSRKSFCNRLHEI